MSKPTLDSIASAKAKLEEELRKLQDQEAQLRQQQSADAFAEVAGLLSSYGEHFSAKQKAELIDALGAGKIGQAKKPKNARTGKEVAPKYWLPHSGETWTGRGRPPKAFAAWEGTAAYREWKAAHPQEKFPKFPG